MCIVYFLVGVAVHAGSARDLRHWMRGGRTMRRVQVTFRPVMFRHLASRGRCTVLAEVSHFGLPRCLVCVMELQARDNERSERPDGGSDMTAFESFFRSHYRGVVRLAQSVLGESQGAQDVAQDVFLAAYRRFPDDYEQAAGWV